MRKTLALAVLAVVPVLCGAPAAGSEDDNLLGLFYDEAAAVNEIEISPNTQHTLYIVLMNPVNDSYDGGGSRDVAFVSGFECAVVPPTGDYVLDVQFPMPTINAGDVTNIVAGYYDILPVGSNRAATLAMLSVLSAGNNSAGYRYGPTATPSHPGSMAFVDAEDPDDDLVAMLPASGAFEKAVFWFGDWHVEQARQWGEVKALFR